MIQRFFVLILFVCTQLSCSSKNSIEGITPQSHALKLETGTQKAGTVRDRYRTFDRETIRRRFAGDPRYGEALQQAQSSVERLVSMGDDELRALIPPANTKRALMVHRSGCPVHGGGTAVYQPFGTRADLAYPLKVRCPIGGEVYPNAKFPDDGQGWLDNRPVSPTKGERYYFVGWFDHWFLLQMPDYIRAMAQIWYLTGEQVYADKARVLIERFAEVYPDIDSKDLTYDGTDWGVYVKMTGSFWEGGMLTRLMDGIELLLPSFDDDFIRVIHERIYRPAYEAYHAKPASGNWGNLWNPALARIGAFTGDNEILNFTLFEHPAAEVPTLDNQFMRDGFPFEASISYASTYHSVAAGVAAAMGDNGRWIWEHPHLRESFHGFADLVCLDKFTHFAADAGGIHNSGWTLPVDNIRDAYRAYQSPELARYLVQAINLSGLEKTISLDDLFREPLDLDEVRRKAAEAAPINSTVAPVRGFAILRTGQGDDRTALFLDYGFAHAAHSHADRLNINLFALGREFIPEMGYPEYMDHLAPATGGWTTNTVCHVTVEVDEKRQLFSTFGDLHGFAEADGFRYVDASCEDTYAHCGVNLYRRTLVLIDIPGGAYAVDLFRVRGGNRHDYLFHGPPVDVEINGPAFPKPGKGTLAGENIKFGWKPDGIKPYGIDNSGYQYLFDVRERTLDQPCSARWRLDDGALFEADFVPDGSETLILTSGYPRPASKSQPPMPFLVRRKYPRGGGELSQFATVISVGKPGDAGSPITGVRHVELTGDPEACALLVTHRFGEDLVMSTTSTDGRAVSADGRFRLNGQLGVASWRNGRLVCMTIVGGTDFAADTGRVQLDAPETKAAVRQVSDDRFVLDRELPQEAVGRVILVDRGTVRSAYRVEQVGGKTVHISPTTWLGRGRVQTVDSKTGAVVDGRNIFRLADIQNQPYSEKIRNYYTGAWITTETGSASYRVQTADARGVVLDTSSDLSGLSRDFPEGSTFLIYDLGPGDTVRLLAVKQVVF